MSDKDQFLEVLLAEYKLKSEQAQRAKSHELRVLVSFW